MVKGSQIAQKFRDALDAAPKPRNETIIRDAGNFYVVQNVAGTVKRTVYVVQTTASDSHIAAFDILPGNTEPAEGAPGPNDRRPEIKVYPVAGMTMVARVQETVAELFGPRASPTPSRTAAENFRELFGSGASSPTRTAAENFRELFGSRAATDMAQAPPRTAAENFRELFGPRATTSRAPVVEREREEEIAGSTLRSKVPSGPRATSIAPVDTREREEPVAPVPSRSALWDGWRRPNEGLRKEWDLPDRMVDRASVAKEREEELAGSTLVTSEPRATTSIAPVEREPEEPIAPVASRSAQLRQRVESWRREHDEEALGMEEEESDRVESTCGATSFTESLGEESLEAMQKLADLLRERGVLNVNYE